MSAVARGTPSFALPPTQNTAPVHEFRCLYTHDILKKAKKWHDGSARFHTFNKRVMVYDDTKNYIGDLHYRAKEEFGEGTELQLDRGVLVEIGECVGETQTDLSGIVNKPHADGGNILAASVNVQPQFIQRANTLNSQGRPKSLTELLGPTHTRLGRGQFPTASPFEQRHVRTETQHDGPPSKKRKVALGKENAIPILPVMRSHQATDTLLSRENARTFSAGSDSPTECVVVDRAAARNNEDNDPVVEISSDEDLLQRPRAVSKNLRKKKEVSVLKTNRNQKFNQVPANTLINNQKQSLSAEHSLPSKYSEHVSTSQSQKMSLPEESTVTSNSNSRPRMSILKMMFQKPRRKLIYKALLPSRTAEKMPAVVPIVNHQCFDCRTPERSCDDEIVELHKAANPDPPAERTPPLPENNMASQIFSSPKEPSHPSPLFVSQTGSQQSLNSEGPFAEDIFSIPATQQILQKQEPEIQSICHDDLLGEDWGTSVVEPESPCFPQPPSRSKASNQALSTLLPTPQPPNLMSPDSRLHQNIQRTPSPSKFRRLARSLSANDSPLQQDPRAIPSHHFIAPVETSANITRLNLSNSLPKPPLQDRQSRSQSPSRSALRRSHSDAATIIPVSVTTTEATSETSTATTDEQGPWTKLEGFLLFDKWPSCKQKDKPVFKAVPGSNVNGNRFGTDEDSTVKDFDGRNGRTMFAPASAKMQQPVLIRSARHVLRDGN